MARWIGRRSVTHSSTIATSGCSSVFITPPALKLIAFRLTAAQAAKHSAHRTGTRRQTANARIAARAIQGTTGQATTASGMPTNTRIVEMLTTIFTSSRPRNSRLAATAIAMFKNSPTEVRLSAMPGAEPGGEQVRDAVDDRG